MRNKDGFSDTDDDGILISGVWLSVAFVSECTKKANKRKRSIWTRRWIEQREKHGAYHILVANRKVNKQQLTNQHLAFSATCCTDRAGCYSDLGCATCCATQQQPMTDVQQKSRSKVAQQKSTCVIGVTLGQPFVKRFALCYRTLILSVHPVSNAGGLWPNGWMDQDETWHRARPWPRPHCVRWGPSSPQRGTNFRPMSVVAKRLNGSRCHLARR